MRPETWLLAGALLLTGCAPAQVFTPNLAPEYITVRETSFFLRGPQQPGRPEKIPPRTLVTVAKRETGGYSIVSLADGRRGFVASDDIRMAPPPAVAVSEPDLFPERYVEAPPLPEPDFAMPVEEIPDSGQE